MITPAFAVTMTAYNAEMNRRLYGAANRLRDEQRRADRGAFWGSIHGTLAHLIWADAMWMSRFDGWDKPSRGIKESGTDPRPFPALEAERVAMDARLQDWAARVDPGWLAADLTWFSGGSGAEMTQPRALLVTHMFNHQTHHRGQAHALLTGAGEDTGATDLPWVL